MTKRKRCKVKPVDPLQQLTDGAFAAWAETGDVTGLGALADALDERGEKPGFAERLREVMVANDPDVRFFWNQADYSYSEIQGMWWGRLLYCAQLAKAEDWFEANEYTGFGPPVARQLNMHWENDPGELGIEDGHPAWVGFLQQWTPGGWATLASLGQITFGGAGYPSGDPYARVVRADLCLEAMPEDQRRLRA